MSGMVSQIPGVFTQSFVQTQIKENITVPRHWLFVGNSPVTDDFPQEGPVTRKMFFYPLCSVDMLKTAISSFYRVLIETACQRTIDIIRTFD